MDLGNKILESLIYIVKSFLNPTPSRSLSLCSQNPAPTSSIVEAAILHHIVVHFCMSSLDNDRDYLISSLALSPNTTDSGNLLQVNKFVKE
jgi:hypothetical protein